MVVLAVGFRPNTFADGRLNSQQGAFLVDRNQNISQVSMLLSCATVYDNARKDTATSLFASTLCVLVS